VIINDATINPKKILSKKNFSFCFKTNLPNPAKVQIDNKVKIKKKNISKIIIEKIYYEDLKLNLIIKYE
tara:strand:- start:186 stop:392 length:207 start_codon:yes stop_codon:yes gene_type:complete